MARHTRPAWLAPSRARAAHRILGPVRHVLGSPRRRMAGAAVVLAVLAGGAVALNPDGDDAPAPTGVSRTDDRASRGGARQGSVTPSPTASPLGRAIGAGDQSTKSPPKRAPKPAPTTSSATTAPKVKIPASCAEYQGNRAIGCALLADFGFALSQMPPLDKLWERESGWNHKASNPSTGAYGIPQALPGSKMASAGDDWRTNPATQIRWGLDYIKDRYGSPSKAWSHFQTHGWY